MAKKPVKKKSIMEERFESVLKEERQKKKKSSPFQNKSSNRRNIA